MKKMTTDERKNLFEHFVLPYLPKVSDLRTQGKTIDVNIPIELDSQNFFTAPASTKYHGAYEGGLFDHSYNVMNTLVMLTHDNGIHWQRKESPYIIGFFHDICKTDQYKQKTEKLYSNGKVDEEFPIPGEWEYREDTLLKGHGDKSVMLTSRYFRLTMEEIMCIRYHMGAFTDKKEWTDYTNAIHAFPNVLWTHHADMIAAHILKKE